MIALILLVVIGLASAAAMRSSVSHEKVVNNLREEVLAQQYAEMALRFCIAEMQNPASTLLTVTPPPAGTMPVGLPAGSWNQAGTWFGTNTRYTSLNATAVAGLASSTDSSLHPSQAPQCLVEQVALQSGQAPVYVITARGFSPAYQADGNGRTVRGSAVWLQAILS